MNKQELLKYIASTAYDVGFGAKKHFATFDFIEKGPGWLGFLSLVGGIYGLFVPFMSVTHVSAAFVVFGVVSLYIGMYGSEKQRYEDAGKALTEMFHTLHVLYGTVKSLPDTADVSVKVLEAQTIRTNALAKGLSKQMLLADWYAHYKFFWQAQIGWIEEQRPFNFFRDKVPLSAYLTLGVTAVAAVTMLMRGAQISDDTAATKPVEPAASAGAPK